MNDETKRNEWLKLILRCLIGFCSALILFYPFETTVVPEWKIRFIDEQGQPYADENVREIWKHYTLELDVGNHREDRVTDSNGYVVFPERTISASLANRVILTIYGVLNLFIHGSMGIHAYILFPGDKIIDYVPGQPPPSVVVVKRD